MIRSRKQLHKTKPKRSTSNLTPIKRQLPNIVSIRTLRTQKTCFHRSEFARRASNSNILTSVDDSAACANKAQRNGAGIRAIDEEVRNILLGGHWDPVIAGVGETDETGGS